MKLRFGDKLLTFWMLLVGGNAMLLYTVTPLRYAHYAVVTLVLGRWLLSGRRVPLSNPIFLGIAGGWGAALLSIITSQYWHGLEAFWHMVANGLLLFWLQDRSKTALNSAWGAVEAAGLLIGGVTLAEWALTGGRPVGLYLNINLNGAMLALCFLAVAGRQSTGWRLQIMILGAALLVSLNRGAWLGVSAGLVFFLLQKGLTRQSWIVLASVGLLVGIVSLQRGGSDSQRMELWWAAQKMLIEQPFGVGVSNFHGAFFSKYCVQYCDDKRMMGAHNVLLNIGAETGILGLLAAINTCAAFALKLPSWRKLGRTETAAAALLAAVAIHQMVDYFPAGSYAFLINLAVASLVKD